MVWQTKKYGGPPPNYSGGLMEYITSNVTTVAPLTRSVWDEWVRKLHGGEPVHITETRFQKEIDEFCSELLGFSSTYHLNSLLDVGGAYPKRPELVYSHWHPAHDLRYKNQHIIDVDLEIQQLEPDMGPLMNLIRGKNPGKTKQKIAWLEDELIPHTTLLAATAATIPSGLFKVNDIVRIERTGEIVVVQYPKKNNLRDRIEYSTLPFGATPFGIRSGYPSSYAAWDLDIRNRYGYRR